VILAAHKADSLLGQLIIAGGILALSLVVWVVLRLSPWIAGRMGATGINIMTRIMGLMLTAIAVEFIVSGIKGMFPMLA